MNIEPNVKRFLIFSGFISNELFVLKDVLNTKEHGRIRNDMFRAEKAIKDCFDFSGISKESRVEIDDTILELQCIMDSLLTADAETINQVKELLEL